MAETDRPVQGRQHPVVATLTGCALVLLVGLMVNVAYPLLSGPDRLILAGRIAEGWEGVPASHDATTWNAPCGLRPPTNGITDQNWQAWRDGTATVTVGELTFHEDDTLAGYLTLVENAATSTCDGWVDAAGQRWELTTNDEPDAPTVIQAAPGTHGVPVASSTTEGHPVITWQASLPGGAGQSWAVTTDKHSMILVSVADHPLPDQDGARVLLAELTGLDLAPTTSSQHEKTSWI